jgi:NADPH:quinone reductase
MHGRSTQKGHPMRAIRIHEPGGAEALRFEEAPEPQPKAGEALVAVEAIGVNYIDVYYRTGAYAAPLPLVPGMEAAGTVVVAGEGACGFSAGDRVAWAGGLGAYAERCAVASERLVPVPDGVEARQAAAAMLQGMTAHYLATSTWPLQAGETCLVHAAAGGVGLLLCQIAKRRGARVLATVSSPEKAELARGAGADHVILYTREDFVAEVKRLTDGAGVEVVYDGVGAATFRGGLDCLRRRGLMALYGQASGPVGNLDPQVLNAKGSLFLTRPTLFHYVATRRELLERAGEVLGWVRDGHLRLRMEHAWPLSGAAEAHRALEGRKTPGKVLLLP